MQGFEFLKSTPYFKDTFEQTNSIFYYYEHEKHFHARIFLPKNEHSDFSWHFYQMSDGEHYYYRTDHIPPWFQRIVQEAAEIVYYRDRIRRLASGKDNQFYKSSEPNKPPF